MASRRGLRIFKIAFAKGLTLTYHSSMHIRFNPTHTLRRLFHLPYELGLILLTFAWLYHQTMPPGMSSWQIEGWDSAVLQITGSSWGIPHSPAYPLYTMLANLFVRWLDLIPALNQTAVVWRVTMWSTVTSLLTLIFLYFTVWKLTHDRIASTATCVVLGVSFIFWRGAIMAEVYSMNALIFALTYWLALTWLERPRRRYLIMLGLVLGAGLVHHRTALILPPTVAFGVLWYSWRATPCQACWVGYKRNNETHLPHSIWKRLRLALSHFILLTVTACLPLVTYLYLPWAALNRSGQTWLYGNAADWNTFWFMVATREWWGLVHPPATNAAWWLAMQQLLQQQADQITLAGVILGFIGLLLAYRTSWLFLPPLFALTFFGLAYKVVDLDSMLIPLTLTLCIGLGIFMGKITHELARWSILYIRITDIKRSLVRQSVRRLANLMVLMIVYLVFSPLAESNYRQVNLSGDWQAEDLVEEVLAIAQAGSPLTIIGQDNSVLPDFIYAKSLAARSGGDIEALSTTTLSRMSVAESQTLLRTRLAEHRRILVDRETIDLGFIPWLTQAVHSGQILLAPTGHPYLWELLPRPISQELPPAESALHLAPGQFLAGQLSIIASHEQIIRKRTGCFLRLTLFWQAATPLSQDYFVAVQPLGGETVLDKNDHLALMRGFMPTSQIRPREIIRDEVDLLIRQPADLPLISLVVNLYQVQGNEFPTFGDVTLPITVDPLACNQPTLNYR